MVGGGGLPVVLLLANPRADSAVTGLQGCALASVILALGWLVGTHQARNATR